MDKFAKSFCINKKFLLITVLINLSIHQCSSAIIHKIMDFKDPVHLTVNECRASCLKNFLINDVDVVAKCSNEPDCFMCWDYCLILRKERKIVKSLMCTDDICFSGCKFACRYYKGLFDKPNLDTNKV